MSSVIVGAFRNFLGKVVKNPPLSLAYDGSLIDSGGIRRTENETVPIMVGPTHTVTEAIPFDRVVVDFDVDVYYAAGENPVAIVPTLSGQTVTKGGYRILAKNQVVIYIKPGDKLSFITAPNQTPSLGYYTPGA